MKKKLSILSVLLLLTVSLIYGQNYQMPNNTFENWDDPNTSSTTQVPAGWHSFSDAGGSWASMSSTNHSGPRTGHNSTYCCMIKSHKVLQINANGSLTTGKIMIEATSASSNDNYTYSNISNSNGSYAFAGRPDSVKMYVKFKRTNDESNIIGGNSYGSGMSSNQEFHGCLKLYIHSDVAYEDRPNDTETGYGDGLIAKRFCVMPSTNTSTGTYETGWTQFAFDLKYFDKNTHVQTTTPTVNNTNSPAYLLADFSTSRYVGHGHYGDQLWIDDIWFVYNKKLSSLKIGNTTLTDAEINTLNNAAYSLANGATTNTFASSVAESSYPTYTYTTSVCASDLAGVTITATAKSTLATVTVERPATVANPYAIIKVTHTDNSKYYFRVYFSNIVSLEQPTISGATSACNNGSVTLTASSTTSGVSYRWYNGETQVGTSATYTPSYSNITSQTSYTYTCKALKGECSSTAASHTVSVNPQPTVSISASNTSVCYPSTISLTANGANTYTWAGIEATGNPITVDGVGTYSITVTGTNTTTNCSNTASTTVTVNPLPTITITPSATSVCAPNTITLTADGADSYTWSNGLGSDAQATVSNVGTYTVTVTGTNTTTTCSNTATQSVTIKTRPTVTISGDTSLCTGATITLTANSQTGVSFEWSDESQNATLEVSTGGTYSVTGTLDGCVSESVSHHVSEYAVPTITSVTPGTRCGEGPVTLEAASSANSTCYWYATATTSESLGTGNSYTTNNLSQSSNYYVQARNAGGCASERTVVAATVNSSPDIPEVTNISNCGAGDFTLTASVPEGVSLQWFADEDTTQLLSSTDVSVDETTTYYVRSHNANCNSSVVPMTITINPIPAKPTNITSTPVCGSGTSSLSATPAADCAINWFTVNDVNATPVSVLNSYTTQQLTQSRKYYVLSKSTTIPPCVSEMDSITVNVYPIPELPNVQNTTLCAMGEVTLEGTPGDGGTTLRWYNEAGNQLLETGDTYTVTISANTTKFKVASYNAEVGCEGDKKEITVTVSATIPVPEVASTVYACGGSAVLTASAGSGANIQWYDASEDELSTGTTLSVSEITSSTTYKVSAKVGNCESAKATVTVEPATVPPMPTAQDTSRCGAGEITLTATVAEGLACRWYADNTSTEVLSDENTYTTDINATAEYFVAAINTTTQCASERKSVQAVMKQLPFTPTTSSPVAYCGPGTYALTANANGNTTGTLLWFRDAEGTQEVTSPVEIQDTTTFYAAWKGENNCRSTLVPLTVNIKPIPEMPTATAPAPSCSNSAVQVTLTANPGANGDVCRWYDAETAGNLLAQNNTYGRNLSASATYYISTYNIQTTCESAQRLEIPVVIYSLPPALTIGNQERCGAGRVTFTGNVTESTTLNWYSEDNILLHTGDDYTTDSLLTTTDFKVRVVSAITGCESEPVTAKAIIHPAVETPVVEATHTLCGAGTITLTATTTQGNSIRWCADAAGETQLSTNSSYTTQTLTEGESYTYYVGAYNTNCSSTLVPVTVDVYARPTIENVTDANRCGAGDVQLSAEASNGAQVRWYENENDAESVEGNTLTLTIEENTTRFAEAYNSTTGCVSARVPVTAYVYDSYELNDPQVACDSLVWNGQTYYESGNYPKSLQTIHGCDSIVTLQLTINTTKYTTVDSTVCDAIDWNEHHCTQSGIYRDTLTAACNCDSIVTLNLTVKQSTVSTDQLTLCRNQLPFEYNGVQIDREGQHTVTISNAAGCDSVITLTVVVNPTPDTARLTSVSRCGEGNVLLQAGVGQNGTTCYWYADDEASSDTVHSGTTYTLSVTETTTFYVASVNTNTGCMSARKPVTATVNPVPAAPHVTDTSRCGEGPVTLTVTVDDSEWLVRWYANQSAQAQLLNTGLQYHLDNMPVSVATYYVESVDTTTNLNCKSARTPITATVYALPTPPTVTPVTNCGPDNFTLSANNTTSCRWYEAANDETPVSEEATFTTGTVNDSRSYYVSNVNTTTGCESGKTEFPITIYLVYTPTDLYDTTCQGAVYTRYGLNYNCEESGEQDFVLATTSTNNCDSLVTLHLFVKEKKYTTLTETACNSYEWDGSTYTSSTTDVKTYTAANGCDSIVTLNLTINYSASTPLTQTTCQSDEPYHYVNGQQIDTTFNVSNPGESTYTFLRHTVHNCDSVITLTLTVLPKVETVLNEVACDSYVWDGTIYTSSTTDVKTYTAANGCDSIVTLNLTVNHSDNIVLTDTVCAGSEYHNYGFDTTITATGNHVLTHQGTNTLNCDSTTTLTLTVTPVYNRTISAMICSGGSYPFNGQNLTEANTYVANLSTVNGCDSIVTLNLTVGDQFRDTITAHVCAGGSYNANNFHITNATSTQFYENSGHSASGCDSTMVLHLIVHDLNTTDLSGAICLGETYAQNGFNVTPSTVGDTTVTRVVQTQYNCDSTVVLHLTVNPVYNLTDTVVTCQSETPYHYDAENVDLTVSTPGTRIIRYPHLTAAGCDSNLTLTLIVNPVYYQTVALTTCQSETPYHYDAENADLDVTVPGVYTFEYAHRTAADCDSIITLTLTVNETKATTVDGSICLGESYIENGFNVTPTMVGDTQVVRTLQTAQHCDSVVTLNLTVNQVFALKDTIETCQSETPYHYDAENVDLNVSAVGTQNMVYEHLAAAGCDSNLTLTLIVNPVYQTTIPLSVCQSETPYVYQNGDIDTTFDVSAPHQETVVYHFQTENNCDSIITLNLTVNPTYSKDTTVSICDANLPFLWNNDPRYRYEQSGDYQIVYELATGCDSIINLHLDVHLSFETDTIIQICQEGLPYVFDENNIFPSQGNYTVELTSPFGCDSIYHVQLVVTPAITHTVTRDICDSELPFPFGGSEFTQAGQYEVVIPRTDGCNEVTYLTLNVHPTYAHDTTLTICESELPYPVGDTTFTEAGTKTVHFSSTHSCDSAVTVTLVVNPVYDLTDTVMVCQSETPYHYEAENVDLDVTVPGMRTIEYEHQTALGCDSNLTLTLIVNPVYTMTDMVVVCQSETPYHYEAEDVDLDVNIAGTRTMVYEHQSASGCDSNMTLTLIVNPTFVSFDTVEVCQSETPYHYENGQIDTTLDISASQSVDFSFRLQTQNGCDSTINLHLNVAPTYFFTENQTVHSTALPFEWHGREFNESTTAYDSLTTTAGCDSIYYLSLTVTEYNIVNNSQIVLCQGETQTWRGRELSEEGNYMDTVAAENTIYMVNVMVNPSYQLYDTMEVCDTELPTFWHDRWFTGDTTMVVNYQTAATYCDSIYTLTFIVHPSYNMREEMSVCADAVPFEWHGRNITESGVYVDSLTTSFGCDSIFTLQVNVTTVTHQVDSMTICDAEGEYNWHGLNLTETGVYADTLRTPNGCDSIVYTMNFVKGVPFYDNDTITLRENQLPQTWRNISITSEGTYYDSLVTVAGCDSIYSLTVYTNEYQYIESTPISLCPGDSAFWRNKIIYDRGTYTDTVETSGAFIIYSVAVSMNSSYLFDDTAVVCQNDLPYIWHDMSLTASGVTEIPLQTVTGCDSIYRLTLIVNPSYSFVESATICSNEVPFPWRGRNLEASGVYYDSLTTQVGGCDSVYQLNLTVNPAVRQNDTATTCRGIAYIWRGQSLQESGFYTDTIPNGACQDIYTLFLTVNEPTYDTLYEAICLGDTYNQYGFDVTPEYVGLSTYQQSLTAENGCDSVITLFLTVNASYLFETTASTCDNTPYVWREHEYTETGVYYDRLTTVTGCDSVYVLYLTVNPTYEIYLTDTAHVNEPYDNYGFQLTPTELGVSEHTLVLYTENGCDSIIHLTLSVSVGVEEYVAPQLRVYPNPAETYVNIEGERMAKVFLYDMHGRLIQMQDAETPEYTRLFLETTTTGFYILKIQLMDGALVSKKIVVKHF